MTQRTDKKKNLYVIVGVVALVSLLIRLIAFLDGHSWLGSRNTGIDFSQRALMFVGIPLLITLLVIKYSKTPKTAYGIVFKTITLFLLMSSILLGEGAVCIIFAAPIFYGVAALIVFINEKLKKDGRGKLYSFSVLLFLIVALEIPSINSEKEVQKVEVSKVYEEVLTIKELTKSPDFMKNFPGFFKIGFPKPVSIAGESLEIGTVRKVDFLSSTKGVGTLTLQIVSKDEHSIVFLPKSDNTHMDHWLTWQKIVVTVTPTQVNKTKITWVSEYTCDLGPSWYFEPLEKYAVGVMNEHLIGSYFGK